MSLCLFWQYVSQGESNYATAWTARKIARFHYERTSFVDFGGYIDMFDPCSFTHTGILNLA